MRKLCLYVLLAGVCVVGMSAAQAVRALPESEPTVVEMPADGKTDQAKAGWSGMTIFLLVFVFSILFVISSATTMNKLGGKGKKTPPKQRPRKATSSNNKIPHGKDRFRL